MAAHSPCFSAARWTFASKLDYVAFGVVSSEPALRMSYGLLARGFGLMGMPWLSDIWPDLDHGRYLSREGAMSFL